MTAVYILTKCRICKSSRTSKRHSLTCGKKAQAMFSEINNRKRRRSNEATA